MDKDELLTNLKKQIEKCNICKKGCVGKMVFGEGDEDAKVIFIGEAPGRNEAVTGKPFIGRAGKILRLKLREIGLSDNDIYITSVVKYLPEQVTPSTFQIMHGRGHLLKQIEIIKPSIIVLLGRVAALGVLGEKIGVVQMRGKVIKEIDGIKYFLTLHPSAVLRFPKMYAKDYQEDFLSLKKLISQN